MSSFLGHFRVTEMTTVARALNPSEAYHLLTLVATLPESHGAFWNLSEGLPF